MKGMKRRDFLKLARDMSACAVIPGAMRSMGTNAPLLMKYSLVDLDHAEYTVSELQNHFHRGNASYVLKEAKRYLRQLEQTPLPAEITRATEIQMRFYMLLARAQECLLPWYERVSPTIGTYDYIEAAILSKLPQSSYPRHHAQLLARRAPLYRESGNMGKSLEQFTLALNHCHNEVADTELLVELYYSRAHIWAIKGDERLWQIDLQRAKEYAQKAGHASSNLLRLAMYTEGEGYKRLAFNKRLDITKDRRAWCATQGIARFQYSHLEKSQWVGHAILNQVAEAQCLILLEPEEAIRRAESLRGEAQRLYPSIVQKIDRTINAARQHLQ